MENTTVNNPRKTLSIWLRQPVYLAFFIGVNLLAGYIGVRFDYPSLFNVEPSFAEYALPLPFTWALSHLPSTLLLLVLLLTIHKWQEKHIKYFRIATLVIFALLFLELDAKSPFILFWKIDTLSAFLASLVLAPPSRESNPILLRFLKTSALVIVLAVVAVLFSKWQHRTPAIENTIYSEGVFELQNIVALTDFHKTLEFYVRLNMDLSEQAVCDAGQQLARALLSDYPYDNAYEKIIYLDFARPDGPINIGEISLNEEDREGGELYPCYVDMNFERLGQSSRIAPPLF